MYNLNDTLSYIILILIHKVLLFFGLFSNLFFELQSFKLKYVKSLDGTDVSVELLTTQRHLKGDRSPNMTLLSLWFLFVSYVFVGEEMHFPPLMVSDHCSY